MYEHVVLQSLTSAWFVSGITVQRQAAWLLQNDANGSSTAVAQCRWSRLQLRACSVLWYALHLQKLLASHCSNILCAGQPLGFLPSATSAITHAEACCLKDPIITCRERTFQNQRRPVVGRQPLRLGCITHHDLRRPAHRNGLLLLHRSV